MEETKNYNSSQMKEKEEEINLHALFFKYFIYWPWFVACVLVCVIGTYIYLRYQPPMYNIKSAVLIKEQDHSQQIGNNTFATIQDMGMLSMTSNFNNEIQILQSHTMVKKVVTDLELYINHSKDRSFGYDVPLYRNEPVKVYMNPEEADKLESSVKVHMDYNLNHQLNVKVIYTYHSEKKELEASIENLPTAFPTEIGVLTFTPDTTITLDNPIALTATISTPTAAAASYCGNLSISPISKATTIAQINVMNTVKQRGIDFIYRLVHVYNQEANDEKNEVAQKTAEFIEERISIINKELGSTEDALATFKQRSRLTNLTSDAQMALQETSHYEQQLTENATQINLVQYLENYIHTPSNANEVIPANVGLQDQNLANVINQYNTMIVERKRLLRTSSENNPAVINMNSGVDAMRTTVQTTVNSVLRGLQITQKNLEREVRKYEGRVSDAPSHEKELISMSRQQEIKASLYIMLLQKREENAITLAATASNGRIIENPLATNTPVAPNKRIFMLSAVCLGLAIPVAIIYLINLLKYRIENRSDIEKITTIPVVGELPKGSIPKGTYGTILVRENKNSIMEESFRNLRTNLLFMLESEQKVIMFTSSQPSEGKSFVAGNLAVSMAYLGKKVIIVGMDIRKPGLNKIFNLTSCTEGITNYLSNPTQVNLFDIIQHSDLSPNLDILPSGTIPPNPTELVSRAILENAISELKEQYDLVILDTAPIAIVTDTAIISRVADMCVYVCRADYTSKAVFQYINVLQRENKFKKLVTVINSIDMSKRKNSFYYGYGHKYGYGQKYGYGYGFEAENKKEIPKV